MGDNDFLTNMDYVDAIMIVDRNGKIVYSVRYNPRFDSDGCMDDLQNIINRNFLEIYPNLNPEDSTMIRCMNEGRTIYSPNQVFSDYKGRVINTQNLTIPIIRSGKILGAIELSKDMTKIQEKIDRDIQNIRKRSFENREINSLGYTFEDIITNNREMIHNIKRAKAIANNKSSVIVYGETGTGKELYVQSIHNYSNRKDKPYIVQNCATLPENLFETIFFGSVRGAFTGALDRAGLFEEADGGTLFLDEINSMPLNLQAKFLRVLQDGKVRRVGSSEEKAVDVRIIAAMNVDPVVAMELGQIREDLFYRLSVVNIKLLPLRKRKEDIKLYIDYFINIYNKKYNKNVIGISPEVERMFFEYSWPGNVRELQHIIESSINFADEGEIQVIHLPVYLSDKIDNICSESEKMYYGVESIGSLDEVLEDMEKKMIMQALKESEGNITKAAEILRITRQRLHYKLDKYRIRFG